LDGKGEEKRKERKKPQLFHKGGNLSARGNFLNRGGEQSDLGHGGKRREEEKESDKKSPDE